MFCCETKFNTFLRWQKELVRNSAKECSVVSVAEESWLKELVRNSATECNVVSVADGRKIAEIAGEKQCDRIQQGLQHIEK